jgi:DHA1 family tetracycline resistance protein-like MFS transporter
MDQPESIGHPADVKAEATSPPPEPGKTGRSAMMIVFLVVFIDLLGFGIVLPLLPRYGKRFLAGDWLLPSWHNQALVTGLVLGVLMSSFSAMQFLFAPIWGRISDVVGRKPILLLGLAGSVLFYGLFGVASELGGSEHPELALLLLLAARIGQGIFGATIATAQAVIADCTTPEKRSRGMALIGAAFGIGFTFGPLVGAGSLAIRDHLGAPGFAAAGLSLLALLLGIVLLPETLRPGSEAVAHRRLLNWHALQGALRTPGVGLLIIMFFLATFAFANFESTLSLLTENALGLPEQSNFYVFAYIGFMLMLAQGGFYQMLARRGVGEITFITLGLVFLLLGMGGLCGFTLAAHQPEIFGGASFDFGGLLAWLLVTVGIAVVGFAFLTPSIQALISRRSDPTRQGEILGVNQSAAALSRILGPVIGLALYHALPSHALPFAVAAGLLALVLLLVPRAK